ncbi:MAG: zf-HC2 domain-containing protein [Candidatus Acidiferrales bacterium]
MIEPIKHFDEMTCLLYLEGELDAARAQELRAHAATCESCGAMLRALGQESLVLTRAFTEIDEMLPARLAEFDRPSPARWAWPLSFGLGAAAAYTLWAGLIAPLWENISQAGFGGTNVLAALVFNGAFWKGWNSMIDTVQTGTLVALGVFAFSLVPLRLRRGAVVAAMIGVIALIAGMPAPAGATEIHRKAQDYTLEKDQVIHDDLIVSGERVEIDGTVDGDLIVFAQSVTVNGHVTGDIIGFAQYLRVEGTVDDNIRGAMNTLTLDGSVGKNVSIVAQSVDLGTDSKIGGSLTCAAGDALFDGHLGRGILAVVDKHTEIEGSVGGETKLLGDHLSIGSTAVLNGPVNFAGAEPPDVADGAHLLSPVHFEQRRREHRQASGLTFLHAVLRYGAALLVGLLLMSILPGFFDAGVRAARRWPVSLGIGALTTIIWIFLVVAGIVLAVLGVGAGLAAAVLYFPIAYSAQIFVAAWLGETIMPAATPGNGSQFGRFALGLLIIDAVRLVPFLGGLVGLAVVMWGIGAILLAIHDQSRRPVVPAVAAA